ncbi:MAG TPA: hypothetical protein VK509_03025, partial [Polyangiales bacterium]|nr:hypothetical protein [Polyangiales bacterium]
KGDVKALASLVDWDTLMARATAGLGIAEETAQDTRKGLVDAAKTRGIFFALVDAAKNGGGVRYLEAKSAATRGERKAVFRVLQPSGSFDHYAFLLSRRADKRVLAVDWSMLSLGEELSAMLRRMLSPMQSDRLAAIASQVSSEEALILKSGPQVIEMQSHVAAGRPQDAIAVYDKLPPSAQHAKLVLITRIAAAQKLGDEALRVASEDLIKYHPNDPSAALAAIDVYVIRGEHDKALAAVDKLTVHGGPDPYFHVLRGNMLLQMKKLDEAEAAALQAVTEEPELAPAKALLASIAALRSQP